MTVRDSKFFCQHFRCYDVRNMKFANRANIIVCKPPVTNMSTFIYRIQGIISFCPQKKMLGADTWRIVAMMKHAHAIRDRTVMDLPGYAMCSSILSIVNHPITIKNRRTSPKPTIPSLFNFNPKSLFERKPMPTSTTTKLASFFFYCGWFSFEFFPTSLTIKNQHSQIIQQTA